MKLPAHLCVEELRLAPGQEWTGETEAWRFLWLSTGSAYCLSPLPSRALAPGELLVAAPRTQTVIRASQLGEVVLYGFVFNPEILCGFLTLEERRYFENGDAQAIPRVQFFASTDPLSQGLAQLSGLAGHQVSWVDRAEVLRVAARFFAGSMRPPPTKEASSQGQGRFQQIMSQMSDMEFIRHTPDQLASLCDCSPRHFNRLFRRHFGESLRMRQTELRLLKACRALESSEEKINQVAADCGYQSLSLFSSLFRRRFGVSPTEWRQQRIKNTEE